MTYISLVVGFTTVWVKGCGAWLDVAVLVPKNVDTDAVYVLPQKSAGIRTIAPAEVPVSVRTAVSLNDTVAVADLFSARLTDCPAVEPPKLMGPEELSAVIPTPYGVP
jgi:hypothetical protein